MRSLTRQLYVALLCLSLAGSSFAGPAVGRQAYRLLDDVSGWARGKTKSLLNHLPKTRPSIPGSYRSLPAVTVWWLPDDAFTFHSQFREGATYPNKYLDELRRTEPRIYHEWMKSDKRLMLIGAGADNEQIRGVVESYKAQGYGVFFYQDCQPLCDSRIVGAMFASANEVAFVNTPNAKKSEYIRAELGAAAVELDPSGYLLIITPSRMGKTLSAAGVGTEAIVVGLGGRDGRK